MQVLLNTDNNIDGTEALTEYVEGVVTESLSRYAPHLTRVEVHLSDGSAGRSTSDDIRCLLEARPAGGSPHTVTHNASVVNDALSGALQKLNRVLETASGKLDDRQGDLAAGGAAPA
ncbi:MAG: HPF/RaiA family ribosome-associated protein [Cryobacterium sp.]